MENTILEKKKIKVRPITRSRAFFRKGHDGEFMYTGCRRIYGLPYSSKDRSFYNPFLKDGEQTFFEEKLNQQKGSLNLYDLNSKFWGKFTFSLDKEGIDLNLENPTDALIYRIMLVSPKFATDENERDIVEREYILIDEEKESQILSSKSEVKDKAMDYMYKIKKSKKAMYDVLRLLNKKPDMNSTLDWFKNELYQILDQSGNIPGVVGIKQFIQVMEDPTAENKIFVFDAIDSGEIIQGPEGYRLADGRKYIGKDLQNVFDYFNEKTPEIDELKLIIKQRIKKG